MPVDWNKLDGELDGIVKDSADKTDDVLASRISSLTRMTDDEVKELFPKPADVKRLNELMKIVTSNKNKNDKVNDIVDNASELGGVVLTLLKKLV